MPVPCLVFKIDHLKGVLATSGGHMAMLTGEFSSMALLLVLYSNHSTVFNLSDGTNRRTDRQTEGQQFRLS